jgi:hypothetical protein
MNNRKESKMNINRGLFVMFVAVTLAISAFGAATGAGDVRPVSADNSEGVVTRIYTPGDPASAGIQTASALLTSPAYNTETQVYGRVSGVGELFCPCFTVASGGKSVDVWFDLMGQEPRASVPDINNGAWVIVTGQLKRGVFGLPSRTFWASDIEPHGQ